MLGAGEARARSAQEESGSGVMIVYLVTDGEYSDYRVKGVASTMEIAEEMKKLNGALNDIEEYNMDELPPHPAGMYHYRVPMDRDGGVSAPKHGLGGVRLMECDDDTRTTRAKYYMEHAPIYSRDDKERGLVVECWARDEKHAIKIANDIRTQVVASGEWDALRLYEGKITEKVQE